MRVISEPIQVRSQRGQPRLLLWRARPYPVQQVLDTWRASGRWWLQDSPRDYWLLDAGGLTAEVYRTRTGTGFQWVLSRVGD